LTDLNESEQELLLESEKFNDARNRGVGGFLIKMGEWIANKSVKK
jgi:hypothetical protein